MNGTFPEELLSAGEEGKLLTALKRTAYDTAFVSRSIFKTEIAAHRIMTFLLDNLVPAALSYDTGCRPGLMEEKFLEMIPADYRQVYARQTKGLPSRERTAARIRMVTDSVSAMTDTYARDLYSELTDAVCLILYKTAPCVYNLTYRSWNVRSPIFPEPTNDIRDS